MDSSLLPVVTVCQGHRCRVLFGQQRPDAMAAMRAATGTTGARGVLVSTACLGSCASGPVAGVGVAHEVDGAVRVAVRALVGPVTPAHVDVLGDYLAAQHAAARLPQSLDEIRFRPARSGVSDATTRHA